MEQKLSGREREELFNRSIIEEYLKYGSVDEIFKRHDYNLPISYAGVHRLLDKWGVVKAAGPNLKFSEAIGFLACLYEEKVSLEKLYRNMPPSFQTSMSTMHRILHNIKEGVIRRFGTALIVSPREKPDFVLVGEDVSTPRLELGKPFGSTTLPMGYSKAEEMPEQSILRVLQQEVFTNDVVKGSMPSVIPGSPKPFMYFDIADVRVAAYSITVPWDIVDLGQFSSYKIINQRYLHLSEVTKNSGGNFRFGVREITSGYEKYLLKQSQNLVHEPTLEKSVLNLELALALS